MVISTIENSVISMFLKVVKKEIKKGNCYFINRTLNINGIMINSKQALLNLGIMNKKQIWNYILELQEKDCIKVDFERNKKRDTNSEIYIFKKRINKKIAYIKLTMREEGIICISFHESY